MADQAPMPTAADMDTTGKPPAVDIRQVSFAYNAKRILESVSLRLEEGQFACLIGPNGGGKTTLFRLILGLLEPKEGVIRVFGRTPRSARTLIGYVPQDFDYDDQFPMRVADVVGMGCLNTREPWFQRRRARFERVQEALEVVGLAGFEKQWFSRLSGGQRQRVLIARALASRPRLLLLDEPTANVDPIAEDEILSMLESLKGELTVLLVTHSAMVAARFLDTIFCVNRRVHRHPVEDQFEGGLMRHLVGLELPEDDTNPTSAGESRV